ncbi:MAG TPA: D-alanyl-D-alanine carboxypeptidase family protein [Steroidobacteraceae bacterium]|nr:D-alanyl-D-alanine carboxypeptidase family protein [Steroidobacteraceae bacterium]
MKNFLTALLLTACLPCFAAAPSIPTPPPVAANGYILLDHDSGRVLAQQKSDERMEPASITKLMTTYIVFEALRDKRLALTDTVKVSEHAWRTGRAVTDGSTSFLELGSEVPVDDLIQGMIVQSGNDATIVLAEKLGGTEDGFVQIMNEYAKRLGLTGTHFMNSWGKPDPNHYSTARDIAVLANALIRDFPQYYKYYSQREFTWNKHRQFNRNGLLDKDPSVDGMKTGHTESAKYCLVASAKRNGMRLVSVVLGAPSVKAREDASAALLNYGFTFYETVKLLDAGAVVQNAAVYKGEAAAVPVGSRAAISVTVPRGTAGQVTKQATVNAPLIAPIASGQSVGQYTVSVGNDVVARVPLVALARVDEGGIWRRAVDSVKLWFQ